MDLCIFYQESERLCDKLLLRQRMNLLSQMSATPIDCLFKVSNFYGRICTYLHTYLYMFMSLPFGNFLKCNAVLITLVL